METFLYFDDKFYSLTEQDIREEIKKNKKVNEKILKQLEEGQEEFFLPSVTTILSASPKPFLATWRGSVGNIEADRVVYESQVKGSTIHNAIEKYLQGYIIIYHNPKLEEFNFEKFKEEELGEIKNIDNLNYIVIYDQQQFLEICRLQEWFKIVNPKIIATEMKVFNLEEGYGGTLDALLEIEEGEYNINGSKPLYLKSGIYIIDYKTGKSFEEIEYTRQISAYNEAIRGDIDGIVGALIIHTNDNQIKKGIQGVKTYYKSLEDLENGYKEFLVVKQMYELDLNYQPKIIKLPKFIYMNK